jgi:hypothetical protein
MLSLVTPLHFRIEVESRAYSGVPLARKSSVSAHYEIQIAAGHTRVRAALKTGIKTADLFVGFHALSLAWILGF